MDITNLNHLVKMKVLHLDQRPNLSDKSISKLTNLEELSIPFYLEADRYYIKFEYDDHISNLNKFINLKRLDIGNNPLINFKSIENLTNLEILNINMDIAINIYGQFKINMNFSNLINLKLCNISKKIIYPNLHTMHPQTKITHKKQFYFKNICL